MTAAVHGDSKPDPPRAVLQSGPMPFVELSMETSGDEGAIDVIVGSDVTIRVGAGVSMARLQMVLRAVRSA